MAQVGRRIAERLVTAENAELIEKLGGLHPSVVQAAGMAHDLGHPPFGHIAEEELNAALRKSGEKDGYEGNAQSFRLVTRLEIRDSGTDDGAIGLNLTRATLNAILKYPILRPRSAGVHPKFGAYRSEKEQFEFAREGSVGTRRSLEAEIMDWADDITYAVHDLEDFYRAGKIPLDRLVHSRDEMDAFLEGMIHRLKARGGFSRDDENAYKSTARDLLDFCPVSAAYSGTRTQRTALHNFASSMIHNAVCGTTLTEDGLKRPLEDEKRIAIP